MSLDKYSFSIKLMVGNDDLIKMTLSDHLYDGNLALALGAGVSKFLGFPLWWELVKEIESEYTGSSSVNGSTSNEELKDIIDNIERDIDDSEKFNKLVKDKLYKNANYIDDYTVIENRLLIALGALIMGSKRGSIKEVITYNYDDVLEWYLGLHGFDVRVIYDPRSLTTNSDAILYHPHGFIPLQNGVSSPKLIFSETSYINREREVSDDDKLWQKILDVLFLEKVFIFIGLSGKDPAINHRLLDIYENQLHYKRAVGYWFYINETELESKEINKILKRGIVPIHVRNSNDIPRYLLDICMQSINRIL